MQNRALDFLRRLLTINTLQPIMRIDTLVEGLIVSTFGVLVCLIGVLAFDYLGWVNSGEIAILGVYAYLTVLLYHYAHYKWDKFKERKRLTTKMLNRFTLVVAGVVLIALYLLVVDQAFRIAILFQGGKALSVAVLPGLVALAFPLFAWEWLCKVTPVDEIIRKVFD